MKRPQIKSGPSVRLQLAKLLKNYRYEFVKKGAKGDTVTLISTLVNIALSILLVYISVNQFNISVDQTKISQTQTEIARQQLALEKALAHTEIQPIVDCDLVFPSPGEKSDPYIHIINKSPVEVESVAVDCYAMPFDGAGKAGHSIQRRAYPGHLFFKEKMKPYEFAKTSVPRVPPPNRRPKDIVKVLYVFDLTCLRSGDLANFKNRVAFELREDKGIQVQRIPDLTAHPYNTEIADSIKSQKELMQGLDKPESFLK